LTTWLGQRRGVTIIEGPDDPERAVLEGGEDVVVVIDAEFSERFAEGKPARVSIVSDSSRPAARPKVERVRGLLAQYSAEIGSMRLVLRGVSPAVATPIHIRDVEVSSAQKRAA